MIALRDAIRDRFGIQPTAYRAGRYGLGPNTAAMPAELGFRCDTSVRSGFDYRAGHGPDYRDAPLHPWWVRTGQGAVLEKIGRAHVRTPVTNWHLGCRLLLEKKKTETRDKH